MTGISANWKFDSSIGRSKEIYSKFTGIGAYAPDYCLKNSQLEELVDTTNDWIVQRTGIKERRIALHENTSQLAVKAARMALMDSSLDPSAIDLIIACTVTPDCFTPSVSCMVQAEIGANRAAAFDVNAACSGFVYGVDIADAYIKSGKFQTVLVVAAETLSRIIDYTDRTTCILFGDGAGAAVLTADHDSGILGTYLEAHGTGGSVLWAQALPDESNPFGERLSMTVKERSLKMSGSDVMRFAVAAVPRAVDHVLERSGLTSNQIDWIVPHQANQRIIKNVIKRYHLDENKVYMNLDRFGNTSSASIPLCLHEMKEQGLLKQGQNVVCVGFGGGLTCGAIAVTI